MSQYCFSQMFLNSTFIGSPTWIWKPRSPFNARAFVSSSTSVLVTWPFRISVIMLPRAMMCAWFQSFTLMIFCSSSSAALQRADDLRAAAVGNVGELAAHGEKAAPALLVDLSGVAVRGVDVALVPFSTQLPAIAPRPCCVPAGRCTLRI